MAESKSQNLPRWPSLDELVDYFDTHDMGKHLEQMPEVDIEVDIKRKNHLVVIDNDILARIGEAAKKKTRRIRSMAGFVTEWLPVRGD